MWLKLQGFLDPAANVPINKAVDLPEGLTVGLYPVMHTYMVCTLLPGTTTPSSEKLIDVTVSCAVVNFCYGALVSN